MSCSECSAVSKYKCPVCQQPYCSVVCCKKHKEAPCKPPPVEPVTTEEHQERIYEYPTEDTVPIQKLKLLEQSVELKNCLGNPHVRNILEILDKSPNPDDLIQEYMQEPIFTEFVDECLKVVQPQDG